MVCCRRCVLTVLLSGPIPLIVARCSSLRPTYHVMLHTCTRNTAITAEYRSPVMEPEIRTLPAGVQGLRYLLFVMLREKGESSDWETHKGSGWSVILQKWRAAFVALWLMMWKWVRSHGKLAFPEIKYVICHSEPLHRWPSYVRRCSYRTH